MTCLSPMYRTDSATVPADGLRVDRADFSTSTRVLRKGRKLDDGSVRREAVLARVDAAMVYSWGQEVATVEALSDPEYLDSLRGLAVVAKHPGAGRVDISKPSTYREVGTITGARFDSAEQAVVIEVVLRDPSAEAAVQAGQTGVSEGYIVTRMDATTTPARQLGRRPNHVALTLDADPRMPGAHLRADHQETSMDLATLTALCLAYGLRTDSADHFRADAQARVDAAEAEKTRADAADATAAETAAKLARLDSLAGVLDLESGDDLSAQVDALVTARAAKLAQVRADAATLKVEIPDTLTGYDEILAHVATTAGAPERCDSAGAELYLRGRLHGAPTPDASARFAAGAGARTDADDTNPDRF